MAWDHTNSGTTAREGWSGGGWGGGGIGVAWRGMRRSFGQNCQRLHMMSWQGDRITKREWRFKYDAALDRLSIFRHSVMTGLQKGYRGGLQREALG